MAVVCVVEPLQTRFASHVAERFNGRYNHIVIRILQQGQQAKGRFVASDAPQNIHRELAHVPVLMPQVREYFRDGSVAQFYEEFCHKIPCDYVVVLDMLDDGAGDGDATGGEQRSTRSIPHSLALILQRRSQRSNGRQPRSGSQFLRSPSAHIRLVTVEEQGYVVPDHRCHCAIASFS